MNMPNPINAAIGVVKLASLHLHNPTAVSAETVRSAADECLGNLSQLPDEALLLASLYAALLQLLPLGWLPYVTLTTNPAAPFGAVITDEAGNLAATGTASSCEALAALIAAKLGHPPAGRGEVPA